MSLNIIEADIPCDSGNISVSQMGWTYMAPNITGDPVFILGLTEQNISQPFGQGSINDTINRNFLLRIPQTIPGNDLDNLLPFHGAAVFFEGVAASANLNPPLDTTQSSDCDLFLGSGCVSDLIQSAQEQLTLRSESNNNALKRAFATPPKSCTGIGSTTDWRNVLVTGQFWTNAGET